MLTTQSLRLRAARTAARSSAAHASHAACSECEHAFQRAAERSNTPLLSASLGISLGCAFSMIVSESRDRGKEIACNLSYQPWNKTALEMK